MIHYVLQIILFQLLFLAVYDFFLKKETFFNWNRGYLLITPLLSLVLPFVNISALKQRIPEAYSIRLPEVLITTQTDRVPTLDGGTLPEIVVIGSTPLNLLSFLINLWVVGMVIASVVFLYKVYRLYQLRQTGILTKLDTISVVTLPATDTAFSFYKTIYIGQQLSQEQQAAILVHERIHIEERHTLDLLFFELLRIVCWFNPLVYVFQNKIMVLQEYAADARVVQQKDRRAYYQDLLAHAFRTEHISFINTFFNHSLIKKRIIMLQKSKSKKAALLKYAMLIPAVCTMLFYVACTEESFTNNNEGDTQGKNFIVSRSKVGNVTALTIGVKDVTALTNNQREFLEAAEKEEVFNSFDLLAAVSGEFDKLLFIKNSNRIENIASYKGIFIHSAGDITKKESTATFYERESKHIDFDDAAAVPFAVVTKVPAYPGCEGDNSSLKSCMTEKVSMLVSREFNVGLANELELSGVNRIFLSFLIGEDGEIYNARARAPHPALEDEAVRVINKLPTMQPGEQNGKPVSVMYSLPITFKIED